MKSHASSAMENGLTAQLTSSVTPMPRQCRRTSPSAAKSIFISIGTIMSQISTATGRLTRAISCSPIAAKRPGSQCPSAMPTTMHAATQTVR